MTTYRHNTGINSHNSIESHRAESRYASTRMRFSRFLFSLDSSFSSRELVSRRATIQRGERADSHSAATPMLVDTGFLTNHIYLTCLLLSRSTWQPLSISAFQPDYACAEMREMRSKITHVDK